MSRLRVVPVSPAAVVNVLGVDPSVTTTGAAVVSFDGLGAVRWATWRAVWREQVPRTLERERARLRFHVREVLALVPDVLDLAVVEGPSMRSRFSGKPDERAGLRWMLIDQLFGRCPVVAVAPATRALLAAGSGSASKEAVLDAVRASTPDAHVPDHNVADAVALATAGAAWLGLPVPYTAAQRDGLAAVPWPFDGGHVLAGLER